MKCYLFLDDSGQLHINYPEGDYFVYGGLLVKEKDFHGINKSYRNLIKNVKGEKGIKDELKTSNMDVSTRRRLLKMLSKYSCEQVFVTVKVPSLKRLNFENKRDVARFKNYMIRRLVDKLITTRKISPQCNSIELHIDNQNVAHSAKDSLEGHLYNFFNEENYYLVHHAFETTSFKTKFKVHFKDSETNYLIQAADLLANTMFNYLHGNQNVKKGIIKTFKSERTIINLP